MTARSRISLRSTRALIWATIQRRESPGQMVGPLPVLKDQLLGDFAHFPSEWRVSRSPSSGVDSGVFHAARDHARRSVALRTLAGPPIRRRPVFSGGAGPNLMGSLERMTDRRWSDWRGGHGPVAERLHPACPMMNHQSPVPHSLVGRGQNARVETDQLKTQTYSRNNGTSFNCRSGRFLKKPLAPPPLAAFYF